MSESRGINYKHWIRRKNWPFWQCCSGRALWPTTGAAEPDGRARGRIGSRSSPIGLVSRKFFSGGKDGTRRMLPMLLGYALSVHKLPGNTVDKVILTPGKTEFALGLLLVGATRCHIYSPMQKY
jgi:hypothetical protein